MLAVRIHFLGNVQGVGFRYSTVRVAGDYDITGYVRNLPDGRVEVLVEAKDQMVIDAFINDLSAQMSGFIRKKTQQGIPYSGRYSKFTIAFS